MPSRSVLKHLITSEIPWIRISAELTGMTVLYQYAGGRHVVISASPRSQDSSANSQLSHVNMTIPGRKKKRYWKRSMRTCVLSDQVLEKKSVRMCFCR